MVYVSPALLNVTGMVQGSQDWNRYHNDLWHWFKHAQPLLAHGALLPAEIADIRSEDDYVALAREICRRAARGAAGAEVRVRESGQPDGMAIHEYLVWYEPPGAGQGLFLVVVDRGRHGELRTMFPPVGGYAYYEAQGGLPLN
jgi:hypothetical protein